MTSHPHLALGAIVRNEAPYLLDFLAWNRAVGIRSFLIADDESTDGTSEILHHLARRGLVDHLPYRRRINPTPQMDAYLQILLRLQGRADWVAMLDADEYILPDGPDRDLAATLAALPDSAGALALNWATYGSSGAQAGNSGPTPLRFAGRAARTRATNLHKKMIVRPRAVAGRALNPHDIPLRPGFTQHRPDGSLLRLHPDLPGRTAEVDWTGFRINHYTIRSWAEFLHRKLPRGRAGHNGLRRHLDYFRDHDLNDEEDLPPGWMLDRWRARREELLQRAGPAADLMLRAEAALDDLLPPELSEAETAPPVATPHALAPRKLRQFHYWRQRRRPWVYRPPLW